MKQTIRTELFLDVPLRFIVLDCGVYVPAVEVCGVLGLENPTSLVKNELETLRKAGVTEDEKYPWTKKFTLPVVPPAERILGKPSEGSDLDSIYLLKKTEKGAIQRLLCVNEWLLNVLILRSRKPEAVKFQVWLCKEVLPALRVASGFEAWKVGAFIESTGRHHIDMAKLSTLPGVRQCDYVKTHRETNRVMGKILGTGGEISKDELKEQYPQMILERDAIQHSAVTLRFFKRENGLDFNVEDALMRMYGGKE